MTFIITYYADVIVYDEDGDKSEDRELRILERETETSAYDTARTLVEIGNGPVNVAELVTKVHRYGVNTGSMRLEEFVEKFIGDGKEKEEGE